MDSHTILALLRDALAELYPEEKDSRVVVADAGMTMISERERATMPANV